MKRGDNETINLYVNYMFLYVSYFHLHFGGKYPSSLLFTIPLLPNSFPPRWCSSNILKLVSSNLLPIHE